MVELFMKNFCFRKYVSCVDLKTKILGEEEILANVLSQRAVILYVNLAKYGFGIDFSFC